MLLLIAIALIVLWSVGQTRPHKFGHFIHLLLILALVLILLRYIPGVPFGGPLR